MQSVERENRTFVQKWGASCWLLACLLLTMSCGAALYYLRVAARHAGWAPGVLPFPGGDADLLAAE